MVNTEIRLMIFFAAKDGDPANKNKTRATGWPPHPRGPCGAQGLLCQPFSSRWVGQVCVAVSSCETELQVRSISQGASVKHSLTKEVTWALKG